MVQPVDWIPPCDPNRGEAARRYNAAHRAAFDAYWIEHPNSTWGQRTEHAADECKRQGITPSAAVVPLPAKDIGDIARGLRALADQVEKGDFGDAHLLAWVVDCGGCRIEIGMLGQSPAAGADGHFLFALAQRKLEDVRQQ